MQYYGFICLCDTPVNFCGLGGHMKNQNMARSVKFWLLQFYIVRYYPLKLTIKLHNFWMNVIALNLLQPVGYEPDVHVVLCAKNLPTTS